MEKCLAEKRKIKLRNDNFCSYCTRVLHTPLRYVFVYIYIFY